jgi:heterodisulfide reductase subunit A-like polyferredoxin
MLKKQARKASRRGILAHSGSRQPGFEDVKMKVITTDVAVIGGGAAGCYAALNLAE